jgi:hypothetical protein
VTLTNSSSFISVISKNSSAGGSSWNRASRHFQLESHNQRPCRRCGDECDFEEGNLTCHQVSSFTAECLTDCSTSVVNLNIVQGKFKTMKESGLLDAEFTSLQRLAIRHSDLIKVENLPNPEKLMELNFSNNTKLSNIDWLQVFRRAVHLEKLILANNTFDYIPDVISIMNTTSLSMLDLSG